MNTHPCECCGEFTATKRCSGCKKAWYCSEECQNTNWVLHTYKCNPSRPLNSADHLAFAVWQDMLPSNPHTLKDFGLDKARSIPPDGESMLFNVYVGLIKYCNIKPIQLHKWRLKGRLLQEIKAIFEAIPMDRRGMYYPWLLEHQYVLEDTETKQKEAQRTLEEKERRAWTALGKPSAAPSSAIREWQQKLPMDSRKCFIFYGELLSSTYPSPASSQYLQFGFCVCSSRIEEKELSRAYTELLKECTFDEFCNAFSSRTLLKLFKSKGVPIPGGLAHPLADVLGGGSIKSVWQLKQWIASGKGTPILAINIDYGFVNCETPEEGGKLITLYKAFFESPQSDPLKLHDACMKGRLLDFIAEDMKMKLPASRALFKRLLKNHHPRSETS